MVRWKIAAYGILPVSQRRSVLRRHLQWKANAGIFSLGMETNVGDFYRGLQLKEHKVTALDTVYEQSRIKASRIHYWANELLCSFVNGEGKNVQITFRVSNNDVAFRYTLPREQGKGSVTVNSERTGFRFPSQTTTFLCPQSDAMIGWKRTKPSYEEEYKADAPMNERSGYGHGYTFPCLFKVGMTAGYCSVKPEWTAVIVARV